jgi:hypothetical protein
MLIGRPWAVKNENREERLALIDNQTVEKGKPWTRHGNEGTMAGPPGRIREGR